MKDSAVLDASGAVRMLLDYKLAREINNSYISIISPLLYKFEMGNICWKYVRFSDWPIAEAELFLNASLSITSFVDDLREQEVLNIAIHHKLSFYDAVYLELSQRTHSTLITLDKKLNQTSGKLGIDTFFDPT